MARISVEQKALTDSRFTQLGMSLVPDGLATPGYFMHALGLGVMIYIWNECQERSCHSLHVMDLEAMGLHLGLGGVKLSSSIVTSELGRWNAPRTRVSIRGTKGRIEWLQKRRDDGQKGGRPRKTLGLDRNRPRNNPPTPAPAPSPAEVLSEKTTTLSIRLENGESDAECVRVPTKPRNGRAKPSSLVSGERLAEIQDQFDKLYEYYPRHVGKDAAWRAFVKLKPDVDTLRIIAMNIKARVDAGTWEPDNPERVRFIPHLSTFLNAGRWQDEDVT